MTSPSSSLTAAAQRKTRRLKGLTAAQHLPAPLPAKLTFTQRTPPHRLPYVPAAWRHLLPSPARVPAIRWLLKPRIATVPLFASLPHLTSPERTLCCSRMVAFIGARLLPSCYLAITGLHRRAFLLPSHAPARSAALPYTPSPTFQLHDWVGQCNHTTFPPPHKTPATHLHFTLPPSSCRQHYPNSQRTPGFHF